VVIDPGHGGFDPGAGSGPVKEKAVALQIALTLRARLLEQGGIRVAMTRDDDRFVTLPERPGIARALGADLFVSIHADSAQADDAHGASVYVLSERGSSEAAARFAARENHADTINGVSLSDTSDTVGALLLDLSQREAGGGSIAAGELVLRELRGKVALHYDSVQSAALAVLKAPDIPSILFETGYISNEEDAASLESGAGRRAIADAAAQAIRVFFARRAGVAP
jgi:N-acetylmuramoyl-L-alanine amidase